MKLRITLTTLVTILLLATACASEPAQAPRVPANEDNRQARQIQDLQNENATFREELSALRKENAALRNELAMLTIAAQVSGIENDLPEDSLPTDNPSTTFLGLSMTWFRLPRQAKTRLCLKYLTK